METTQMVYQLQTLVKLLRAFKSTAYLAEGGV